MHNTNLENTQADNEWLDRLRKEGNRPLGEIYKMHRVAFIHFAKKYKIDEADILDIYQDTIIAFFENVVNGKITTLNYTLKTYIFSIGKNKVFDFLKKKDRTIPLENQIEDVDIEITQREALTHRQVELKKCIKELGEKCKSILQLFYYKRYSIEAIRIELGYKDDNVVKAHKSRCMKSLRQIISKNDIY